MKKLFLILILISTSNVLFAKEKVVTCLNFYKNYYFVKDQYKNIEYAILGAQYYIEGEKEIASSIDNDGTTYYEILQGRRRYLLSGLQIFDDRLKDNLGYCTNGKDAEPEDIKPKIKEIHDEAINKLLQLNELEMKVLDYDRKRLKRDGLSQVDLERTPGKKIEENEENYEFQSGVIVG
ncbi:MAG: hypothetical protein H6622_13310 [Halobacteriovoraceae bacterium]|nr:hypothetical protein [Halobacteriovoraceae bacterium]